MPQSVKLTIEKTRPGGNRPSVEKTFKASWKTIKIGRDPAWANFVTPAEDKRVSRCHAVIKQEESGGWVVEPQKKNFVQVNGRPVEIREPLGESAQLRLGRKDGPLLLFERLPQTWLERISETLATVTQELVPKWQDTVRRHAYVFAGALAVLALTTGVAVHLLGQRIADVQAEYDRYVKQVESLAKASISPEIHERIGRAAYLVVLQDADGHRDPKATAFPVAPTIMATNAHVEILRAALGEGEAMLVCSPGEASKCYTVVDRRIHDGDAKFAEFVARKTLGIAEFRSGFRHAEVSHAYDVALLHLAEPVDPAHVLTIASREHLLALRPGTPVAYAGYLLHEIDGSASAPLVPSPHLKFGAISSLTDFFMFGGKAENTQLVQHSVPVTRGASGGPIVDASGNVIAVLNAGSVVSLGEGAPGSTSSGQEVFVPNAALVNYAQRADLVLELIDADRPFDLARAEAYWAEQAARFEDHAAYVRKEFLRTFEEEAGAQTSLDSDQRQLDGPGLARDSVAVSLRAGSTYGFLAYAEHKQPLQIQLRIDGDIVAENAREWMPQIVYKAEETVDAELQVWASPPAKLGYDLISVEAAAATK